MQESMANKLVFSLFLEIEAKEACDWLRVTGFPQYAQLYEGKAGCHLILSQHSHNTDFMDLGAI